jgi:hypothetical protein
MGTHFIKDRGLTGIASRYSLGLTNIIQPGLRRIKFEFENKVRTAGGIIIYLFITTGDPCDAYSN